MNTRLLNSFVMFCLAAVCCIAFAPTAQAADLRVAFVDMQRALSESEAGSKAQKDYEKVVKEAQDELNSKKADFDRQQEKYSKQKNSLSSTAKTERQEKLLSMERDLKRSFQDQQESLRRKNAQLVGGLVRELRDVVSQVGKKEGFTVILEKGSQAVLYADNSIDITDEVIKEFNRRN
ncbi:MAG: OmpH family outer membrane protein [Bdellovibrionales bacterium]|nr:OmpH family outer membrane protein [Bdellovibrionales bacterium]